MKGTHRILSALMALVLVFGLLPAVSAESGSAVLSTTSVESDSEYLPVSTWEFDVLRIVNKERAVEGLDPVTTFDAIQSACDVRATEIDEYFSHTRPNGSTCFTALDEAGIDYWYAGENIAYGYSSPEDVMVGWMNSPGHRANILTAEFTHMGVGYDRITSHDWVQLFCAMNGETYTSAELAIPEGIEVGTEIDDMYMYAILENSDYGTCYLPIMSEFVTGYDSTKAGTQVCQIQFLGFSGTFEITLVADPSAVILEDPADVTAAAGTTAKFTVTASGAGLSYQWQYRTTTFGAWKDATAVGNKTATLRVPATASRSGYQYRCLVTASNGSFAYTAPATLTVTEPSISITAQPANVSAARGATARFTVAASGSGLSYQWQYRTSKSGKWMKATASGNQTPNLSVPATAGRNGYQYRCKITDSTGAVKYSDAATLTVAARLKITSNPTSKTVTLGGTARFGVKASGTGLTYRWQYRSGENGVWRNASASGCRTKTMYVPATAKRNGYQYRCVVTDEYGNKVYSKVATLTVISPRITSQPTDVTAFAGATATFSVAATGSNLSYKWQYRTSENGAWRAASASGARTDTLTVPATAKRNGYQYRCVITDENGNIVRSTPATLFVS